MIAGARGRAFAGGVLLGVAGALVVAALELGWILATAFGWFDGPAELGRFALYGAGLLVGAGLAAGLVEGALAAALRGAPTLVFTLLAAPPIATVCTLAFRGAYARTIPGHQIYAVLIGAAGLAGVHLGVGAVRRVFAGGSRRALWIFTILALALALAGYVADQRVLPRLYLFFHLALSVVVFAAAQLFVAGLWRLRGRALPLRLVPIAAGIGAALAVLGAHGFRQTRGLRTLALERTTALGRLVRVGPRPPGAPPAAAPAAVAAVDLRAWPSPRLGEVDVVLVTIDAMRADRLRADVAPNLTALAQTGVTFDHAYAQVPHTSFSVATLLTGKHVYALSALGLDAAGHQTLAQVLRRERYKTAAFYPPSVFFIDHDRLKGLEESQYGFEYVKYEYLPADRRVDQIIDFFAAEKPARAFVWAHFLEPHEPYEPHPGVTHGSGTADRYDGEIRYVDGQIARLVAWLRANRPHALVIVAADHGEEFGEHGGHYHGTTLYEEQVRVPLVFALLGGELDAARVVQPVGLVDVAPTVLSLLGIERSLRMRGQNLAPLFSRATAAGFPVADLAPQFAEIDKKKMVVAQNDKLICDLEADACQLFDLAKDPGEQHDLRDQPPALALRARLNAWMAAETRFEAGEGVAAEAPVKRALERGRLGDRGATRELAQLLTHAQPSVRREAAQLLVGLPPEPSTRPALEEAAHDAALRRWAGLALARLGDGAARQGVAGWIAGVCHDDGDVPLCARAALALGDVAWEARALDRVLEHGGGAPDESLTLALARGLGASKDARAFDTLLVALAPVRTRAAVVDALAQLGDARAVPTLVRWLPADPYIPVRAAVARALAALAPADPAVRAALEAQAAVEHDPVVTRAISESRARLSPIR